MSKPFDTTLKQATHRRPIDWMYLFGMMGQFQVTWIDTDISTVSLVADRVLRVNGAKPWIMHLEFQSSNDSDLELRLLSYNTLLRNRLGIPVDTCLLLLRPTAGSRKITGNFETKNHDGTVCSIFNFHVVKTWELSPQALLEGRIATVCLLPLSNVKKGELR